MFFDEKKAREYLLQAYKAFRRESGLYAHVQIESHAPQHQFRPPSLFIGSRAHQRWLFFAALTDRRQVSEHVYESHRSMYVKHPELYDERVLDVDYETIKQIILEYHIGVPRQSAMYWLQCARTLFERYEGDPTLIYKSGSVVETLKEIRPKGRPYLLPGFGPKILSLLALFLHEIGCYVIDQADAFPVDVHVQRFFINTGCIGGVDTIRNDELEKLLRPFITKVCEERHLDWVELSHALWFLGSFLCNGCSKEKAAPQLCPVYEECGGGIDSRPYFRKGVWDLRTKRFRKGGERTFTLCPGPLFEKLEPT